MSIKLKRYIIQSSHQELLADLDTPVSIFERLCKDKDHSFLLESVEGGENLGRYSIIGYDPILIFKSFNDINTLEEIHTGSIQEIEGSPFDLLQEILASLKFTGENNISQFIGFVGYFGYETFRFIEKKVSLKANKKLPDVLLTLPGKLLVFDHVKHKITLISLSLSTNKNSTQEMLTALQKPFTYNQIILKDIKHSENNFTSNFTKDAYMEMVRNAKKYIYAGDIFQIVPSQKMKLEGNYDGFSLYRILRSINPSPYLYYLNFKDFQLAGSSPEVMVKTDIRKGKKIAIVRPIAGTYPRGKDSIEDEKNINALLSDEKERAEHLMLVDLARNDLGRVCKTGSVNVKDLMIIEKYSHVFHMVSTVEGELKDGKSSLDLLKACFPHGTLSGAPKIRAIEIINELETDQRGAYGGCLGFFGLNDSINTCITIRTMVIKSDYIEIQAGGGVVADSDPENEYNETLRKGGALLKAAEILKNS